MLARYLKAQIIVLICGGLVGPIFLITYFALPGMFGSFGPDADSPWEVVGSDDTTFSVEQPAYGSTVQSPMLVGGHITGVDENIRVMLDSTKLLYDPATMRNYPLSEYIIKS